MGQGGEWSSETRFRDVWLLQETENLGGGFEDKVKSILQWFFPSRQVL